MIDTYISFYLKANRIRVFVNALRAIGSPSRICFLINEGGDTLIVSPYTKRDFKSHKVSEEVYNGTSGFEINSHKLCHLLAEIHKWDLNCSYRVPGKTIPSKQVVAFKLSDARIIEK